MQTIIVLRILLADTEQCVGPAPFPQAQGPERIEGLVAGPQFDPETVRRQAATLHQLHRWLTVPSEVEGQAIVP
jgi:hypothetical protein